MLSSFIKILPLSGFHKSYKIQQEGWDHYPCGNELKQICFVCAFLEESLRCNTHNPKLRGCWVSTWQGLAGLLQILLQAALITNSSMLLIIKLWVAGGWAQQGDKDSFPPLCQSSAVLGLPTGAPHLSRGQCRTGRIWARRNPSLESQKPCRSREFRTTARMRDASNLQHLHYLRHHHHHRDHRNTRGRDSSSTLSWLTGVPQAASTDSPTSKSFMPRSQKCSTSPRQRYKANANRSEIDTLWH